MFAENFNTAEGYGLYGGFNSVFVCDDGISVAKQVDFPNGWTDDTNLSFKVLFKNGHNCADASTPMTLNGVAVVVNKYGTLIPLPIHEMDDGGTPIYKSLQPNTILEMYYTDNYDGADTPACVIIGNPIVLSSTDYTIYADGYEEEHIFKPSLTTFDKIVDYNGTSGYNNTITHTVQKAGFYLLSGQAYSGGNHNVIMKINDNEIYYGTTYSGGTGIANTTCMPLNVGDEISIHVYNPDGTGNSTKIKIYRIL